MAHRHSMRLCTLFILVVTFMVGPLHRRDAGAQGTVKEVDCADGDTIMQALEGATPGDTLRVTGTCRETVSVTTDRLTLAGQDRAVIDGGGRDAAVLTIEGARGVAITGFTLQNGDIGLLGRRGADFAVSQTTMQDNTRFGLQVDQNTSASVTDSTAQGNGRSGVRVSEQSSAIFTGAVISRHNGDDGIQIVNGSRGALNPTRLELHQNTDAGLVVGFGASAAIIGGTLEATGNVDGLRLESSSSLLLFGITSAALTDNTGQGLIVFGGASLLVQNSTLSASRNGTGIAVTTHADVTLSGEVGGGDGTVVRVENNLGVGLRVAGAALVAMSDDPAQAAITLSIRQNGGSGVTVDDAHLTLHQATISDNAGADVVLSFGARMTLHDSTVGTITCDETVLSRGAPVCP